MLWRKRTRTPLSVAAVAALGSVLSLFVAPKAHGVLISEFLYDAPGPDNGFGFVELAGSAGVVLDGWSLLVINGSNGKVATTIDLVGAIAPDRVYVVADQDAGGTTSVPNADHLENFDIQNGPDSLQLLDAGGTLLDAVGFGDFGTADIFAGEGSPAPDAPAGSSLERPFADLDSDDNGLDFTVQSAPTPGHALFRGVPPPPPSGSPIPEPGSALLSGLGLFWMGAQRRRLRRRLAASPQQGATR